MKFLTKSREEGYKIRQQILALADTTPYIYLSNVIEYFGHVPAPETYDLAWSSEYVKAGNMQVREYKDEWFLYIFGEPEKVEKKHEFPDIDVCVFETAIFEKLVKAIDDGFTRLLKGEQQATSEYLSCLYNEIIPSFFFCTRPCIVKAKKSGKKEERQDRKAKFHRWVDLSKGVQQVLALVEFEDGHVEQVQPDRVIFKEVNEEVE